MGIAVVIYLIIGVTLNIIGPVAKFVNEAILDLKDPSRKYIFYEEHIVSKGKILAFEIIVRSLLTCFFPSAYIVALIDYKNELKKKREDKAQCEIKKSQKIKDIIDNKCFVYFKNVRGGGVIRCHGCGYTQEIIGFTHGFDDPCPFTEGNQCQSCGKFHEVDFIGNKRVSPDKCSCGGNLSREEPIFCPRCKARDVSYHLTYVT